MKITKEELKQIVEEVLKEADDYINPTGMGGSSRWEKTGRMRPHYTSHGADYERYEPTYKMTDEHPDHPDYKRYLHEPPSESQKKRNDCRKHAGRAVYKYDHMGYFDRKSGDKANEEAVYTRCMQLKAFTPGRKKDTEYLDDYFKDESWYRDDDVRRNDYYELYYKFKDKPYRRSNIQEGETKLSVATLKEFVKKTISEMDETMDSGYMPPKDKPKKKSKLKEEPATAVETKRPRTSKDTEKMRRRQDDEYLRSTGRGHEASDAPGVTTLSKAELRKLNKRSKPKKKSKLKEELPMQDYTLDLPPGAVEVTDVEEKVKNFLSTKAYTKASLDDAGRADFVRRHHKEFTQFVLNGEVYHIYGDMMFNSADEEIDPYQIAENIYSKQANMPLEDEADDIIADGGADDIMSLLDGLPPDEKLEIINMLMGDLYQANPELADEFDRMKGSS
jgi:hypothetical protein